MHIDQIARHSIVSRDRLEVLQGVIQTIVLATPPPDVEFWEAGVYRGGTALLINNLLGDCTYPLRLFDTFCGLPFPESVDRHKQGDFSDTSAEAVQYLVPKAIIHKGLIPETFVGLEEKQIAFAHIDVDLYRSVLDCCKFIWPRLISGGVMVFDDYGFSTCPGAKLAVDEYFGDRANMLPTKQAIVIKP